MHHCTYVKAVSRIRRISPTAMRGDVGNDAFS